MVNSIRFANPRCISCLRSAVCGNLVVLFLRMTRYGPRSFAVSGPNLQLRCRSGQRLGFDVRGHDETKLDQKLIVNTISQKLLMGISPEFHIRCSLGQR